MSNISPLTVFPLAIWVFGCIYVHLHGDEQRSQRKTSNGAGGKAMPVFCGKLGLLQHLKICAFKTSTHHLAFIMRGSDLSGRIELVLQVDLEQAI